MTTPGRLVRDVAARELEAANAPGHYMYQLRKETPDGSETKAMIETKDWLVGRLIRINDQPLSPGRRRKEDERLERLLSDIKALRDEEAVQRKDERRVRDLIRALPEAFLYEQAVVEASPSEDPLKRLTFVPNPSFHPPTRELSVLTGMKGTILVNTRMERLVRVEARLFRSVSFGWGILARLEPGGSFVLEQEPIGDGRWAVSRLEIHFHGKLLLFKTLRINSTVTSRDFRRMPDDLSLTQGLELLKKRDQMTTDSY